MRVAMNNRLTNRAEAVVVGYAVLAIATFLGIVSPVTGYLFDYVITVIFIIASGWFVFGGYYRLIKPMWHKYNKIINRAI